MITPFNLAQGLVIFPAVVSGPTGNVAVRLALDTGATESVISKSTLIRAGYNLSSAPVVPVITGSGRVFIPLVSIDKLEALGQTQTGVTVQAHTLPSGLPVDGLLGLDFLRVYRLVVDFRTGQIILT